MSINFLSKKDNSNLICFALLVILGLLSTCAPPKEVLDVNYLNSQIKYSGRVDTTTSKSAEMYWSGSSIKLNFEGESIKGQLKDSQGDNYFSVILDGKFHSIVRPTTKKKYYQLASGLTPGQHTIELFKRTEWPKGITKFYGFQIEGKGKVNSKEAPKSRKIEFFGDSITAGYAVEDTTGNDSPVGTNTNNYLSYAAITARHYDAEYRCMCHSGIGIMISWHATTMPDIYDKLNPGDPSSQWDFANYQPDIVIVNLMQNDSWLVNRPEREEFKKKFGEQAPEEAYIINAYQQFIAKLRIHYPRSKIICMLGNMDVTKEGSVWPGYVEKAVNNLTDENIYTHFVDYKNTPGHPSVSEQQDMANSLIAFIDENIQW